MKVKILTIMALLGISASAYAYHTHWWTKINEFEGDNGKLYCQWECNGGPFATTSGWRYCGRP